MIKMSNENLIHLKFEHEEAVESRKDLLASQVTLLKILKKIEEHRIYRTREFELKLDLYKKIRELKLGIGSLEKTLPKVKIPEILKKQENKEQQEQQEQQGKKVQKKEIRDLSIEEQLKGIQRELDALQQRNA